MTTTVKTVLTAEDRTAAAFRHMVQTAGDSITQINHQFEGLKRVMETAFVGLSVTSVVEFAHGLIESVDQIEKLAIKAGMSSEAMARFGYVAKMADLDIEAFSTGMAKMQRTLIQAEGGAKPAAAAFESIGINVKRLHALKPEDQFLVIAEAISRIEDPAKRAESAMAILGKGGAALLPVLELGAEGVRKLTDEYGKFAGALTEESIKRMAAADDAWKNLKASAEALAETVVSKLAPALSRTFNLISSFASDDQVFKLTARLAVLKAALDAPFQFNPMSWWMNLKGPIGLLILQGEATLKKLEAANKKAVAPAIPAGVLGSPMAPSKTAAEVAKENAAALARRKAAEAAELASWAATEASNSKVQQWLRNTETELGKAQRELNDFQDNLIDLIAGGTIKNPEAITRWLEHLDVVLPEVVVKVKKVGSEFKIADDKMTVYADQAARNMQDAFANFLFDPFKGGLKGMLKGFADMLRQLVAQAVAARIFEKLGLGGKTGKIATFMTMLGFADGGEPPVNRPSIVGERGPEIFIPKVPGTIIPNNAFKDAPMGAAKVAAALAPPAGGQKAKPAEAAFKNAPAIGSSKVFESLRIGSQDGAGALRLPAFARGGDPPVARPSLVGERGPEVFIPKAAGSARRAATAGTGTTTIGTVSPVYNISGLGLSYEQVVSLMSRNNSDLVAMLRNPRMR